MEYKLVKENVAFVYASKGAQTIISEVRDGQTVSSFAVSITSGNQHYRNRLQNGFEIAQ